MTFRKLTALAMTLVMLFSLLSVSVLSADENEKLPQIYVNGFGSRQVYLKDDPDKTPIFPFNIDLLMANLMKVEDYTKQAISDGNYRLVYNYLYRVVKDTLIDCAFKGDGKTNLNENLVHDPIDLGYGGDGFYSFNYDCRLGPVDLAKQLYDYVLQVQEHSGSQKFELVGASYGANVVMTFLNDYPEMHEYIDSALLSVPSYGGFSVIGELFTGDFFIDHDTLTEYAFVGIDNEDLGLLLSILNKSGALEFLLEALLLPGVDIIAVEAVLDAFRETLATLPCVWSFVQPEHFYDALVTIFGEDYNDPDKENAVLIDKIVYYQEQVMQRLDEIYTESKNNGIKMNIICKYGRPPMPVSEKGSFMSDGAVDINTVTLGAISSRYGETLPDDYEQALYPEYNFLSPDNCIDASTGIDPIHTWYVRGLEHTQKNAGFEELIDYIVYEDPDVFSGTKFPQFTKAMPDGSLAPITGPEEKKKTSIFGDMFELVLHLGTMLLNKLSELLK